MRSKDLIPGLKLNRLTIIENDGYKFNNHQNHTYFKCKCDCGKVISLRGELLIRNRPQKSCGCDRKENFIKEGQKQAKNKIIKDRSISLKKEVYNRYVYRAKNSRLKFEFSSEEFIDLIEKECYYCGNLPSTKHIRYKKNHHGQPESFLFNGLDRVNNEEGYTKENSVTCCEHCNRAKRALTIEQFYNMIKKIYEKRAQFWEA